jgi:hypothetical protein
LSSLTDRLAALGAVRTRADLVALARVAGPGALVPLVTRLSLPRQAALLRWRAGSRRRAGEAEVERVVRAVELAPRVANPLIRPGCLTRAMVLYWLLGRGDDRIDLCFGAGRVAGEFAGHAWLTRDGRPYLERVDPTSAFQVTYRIGAAAFTPPGARGHR